MSHEYTHSSETLRKELIKALQEEVSYCNSHNTPHGSYENSVHFTERLKKLHAAIGDLELGKEMELTIRLPKH
jgi:hypothetical protein